MDAQPSTQGVSFRDVIVTLPTWGIGLITALWTLSMALAISVFFIPTLTAFHNTSFQFLIILIPLGSALVAAIGIRRTSTDQIDRLIRRFLEVTILHRFDSWCKSAQTVRSFGLQFPFDRVELLNKHDNNSYAYFQFSKDNHPPRIVGIKTNVFNFEIFTTIPLSELAFSETPVKTVLTQESMDDEKYARLAQHPVFQKFMGIIQGSLNEGYEIKLEILPNADTRVSTLHVSLRLRLRENFLSSPYFKRYLAEDAAIAVGVLFIEYGQSGLQPAGQ